MNLSRRDWMAGTMGAALMSAIAAAQEHAHQAVAQGGPAKLDFFDEASAADIGAIAEQVLPSDDGPGAKEAGVIFFIDRALTTFDSDQQDAYRKGIADLRSRSGGSFAALLGERQMEILHAIEKTEFFEQVRTHTLLGFLGDPSYGGNRDKVGWRHIGFDDRMFWQPPFGYYDKEQA